MYRTDIFIISNGSVANKSELGLFESLPGLGVRWDVEVGIGSIDSLLICSYYLYVDTLGLSLTVFELFSWLQKAFPHIRSGARPTRNSTLNLPLVASASGKNYSQPIYDASHTAVLNGISGTNVQVAGL